MSLGYYLNIVTGVDRNSGGVFIIGILISISFYFSIAAMVCSYLNIVTCGNCNGGGVINIGTLSLSFYFSCAVKSLSIITSNYLNIATGVNPNISSVTIAGIISISIYFSCIAAEYAEYRIALDGPADRAVEVLGDGKGRYGPGPLWEVVASSHPWRDLEPLVTVPTLMVSVGVAKLSVVTPLQSEPKLTLGSLYVTSATCRSSVRTSELATAAPLLMMFSV